MPVDPTTLRRALEAFLPRALAAAADELGVVLSENVAAGARSGEHYPGQPRRSSAEGEYPQEQFGDYINSVEAGPADDPLLYLAGPGAVSNQVPAHAFHLEGYGTDGTERAGLGVRDPVARTGEDPETHRRLLQRLAREFR